MTVRDKFLVDENMTEDVVSLLRHAGYDVVSVSDVAPRSQDDAVLARAVTESRILLTFDKGDFGGLIYDRELPAPPAVVLFRIPDIPTEKRPQFVVDTVVGRSEWPGCFWVIEQERTRSRPLPRSTTPKSA